MDAEVRMMLIPSRLLVFDEPTNHLDVPMKDTDTYGSADDEGNGNHVMTGSTGPPSPKVPHEQ